MKRRCNPAALHVTVTDPNLIHLTTSAMPFRPAYILFFLSVLLLSAYAANAGWEYADCGMRTWAMRAFAYRNFVGSPSNPIQIDSIELSPDPPVPGQDLTVKVKALVTEVIEEGASADVLVKLGLIKLLQKTFGPYLPFSFSSLTILT